MLTLATIVAAVQGPAPSSARTMSLSQVDGGSQYYGKFSNGLPTSKSYFPVGVWFESVTSEEDVARDREVGLNLYVVATANSSLPLISSSGMKVIAQQSEWLGRETEPGKAAMAGWELADEIDMLGSPEAGYATLSEILGTLPADGRLRFNNYGKGITFWLDDAQAARYVNEFQDVLSADNYWFTDENMCAGTEGGALIAGGADLSPPQCHRAANYGATVRRVRRLVTPPGSKPVWGFVELGHPYTEANWPTITPPQIRAAVWQSLIAGARGIIYFNHSFTGPDETQHILRDGLESGSAYAPVSAMVRATNERIKDLSPVLNSPTVRSGWSQGPGTTAMVKWAKGKGGAKKRCKGRGKTCGKPKAGESAERGCSPKRRRCGKQGHLYVFAGSAGSSVRGKFSLPCVGDTKAAVVGEKRSIRVRGGSFRDRFANGNAIHIYRIAAKAACGLSPKG
jgi:hypothetical protein